jgi:predicted dithiol-disulfide oxidoreductase (DUF899 family)
MPATTDYWVNDSSGDPLLVVTGEVDAALTKAMPRLLREVRDVVGERRVTIVFDRGGWSPQLFAVMIKDGFDELPGLSVFAKDDEGRVYHTYSSYARGNEEVISAFTYLDMTPKGRNETEIMDWVKRHDEYDTQSSAACCHAKSA